MIIINVTIGANFYYTVATLTESIVNIFIHINLSSNHCMPSLLIILATIIILSSFFFLVILRQQKFKELQDKSPESVMYDEIPTSRCIRNTAIALASESNIHLKKNTAYVTTTNT